ncbi:MAG: methionyl-tRNA formyltransferase [Alistipes sp.]|nr:methionyl-tRNA formyltransferase [Alistipes sp.]
MNTKELRIVFMGTPEFAATSLRCLVAEGYNIVAVVTTPDKPAGRGQKIHESDVKIVAKELGLPLLQPEKLRDEAFLSALRALQPDLGIVIAFRMLPEVVWAMPKLGTFNLHASLLPEYRGAAPINWAIINGDTKTGVTTFLLNHEIDKGAIIGQREVDILPEDNIGTLYDRLMYVGAGLVLTTVEDLAAGNVTPVEQMHIDEATLRPAPKIFKEDGRIDWSRRAEDIHNLVRGLSPYPAAWSSIFKCGEECGSVKIFATHVEPREMNVAPGTVYTDGRAELRVAAADGWVYIDELQLAGKRRMTTRELLLGWRDASEVTFA